MKRLFLARILTNWDGFKDGDRPFINKWTFLGLIKGLGKAGKVQFSLPDEMQTEKAFIEIEFLADDKFICMWKPQIESYGIFVEEIKTKRGLSGAMSDAVLERNG